MQMVNDTHELRLYSISAVAKTLRISKDTLISLLDSGRIGFILIGKRRRIPYQEIVRFQNESIIREDISTRRPTISSMEMRAIIEMKNNRKNNPLDGARILNKLLKERE